MIILKIYSKICRPGLSVSNAPDMHSKGPHFEFHLYYWLIKYFMVMLNISRQIPRYSLHIGRDRFLSHHSRYSFILLNII